MRNMLHVAFAIERDVARREADTADRGRCDRTRLRDPAGSCPRPPRPRRRLPGDRAAGRRRARRDRGRCPRAVRRPAAGRPCWLGTPLLRVGRHHGRSACARGRAECDTHEITAASGLRRCAHAEVAAVRLCTPFVLCAARSLKPLASCRHTSRWRAARHRRCAAARRRIASSSTFWVFHYCSSGQVIRMRSSRLKVAALAVGLALVRHPVGRFRRAAERRRAERRSAATTPKRRRPSMRASRR